MSGAACVSGAACESGPVDVLFVAASVARRDGGSTTAILGTAAAVQGTGRRTLTLATTADGPAGRLGEPTDVARSVAGAPLWFCRRSRPRRLKNSWQLAWRTLRCAGRAGVIHVHGVYLANSVWAYLASRLSGTRYVVQPHGALEPYQEQVSPVRKRVFNRLIGDRIIRSAAALIATSPAEAANLRRRWPAAQVAVVPFGVERATPVVPAAAAGLATLAVLADLPREQLVTFVGRWAAKKRPDLLVRAWAQLETPGHLVLAGPEQDWTAAQLLDLLPAARRDSVTVLGELSAAEVAWLLSRSGVFVLPSENENFALAVTEAMGWGCAVVTTAATGAAAHVTRAGAGVVLEEPGVPELADALARLLSDPREVARLGARGRAYADTELTWAAHAQLLVAAYDDARFGRPQSVPNRLLSVPKPS